MAFETDSGSRSLPAKVDDSTSTLTASHAQERQPGRLSPPETTSKSLDDGRQAGPAPSKESAPGPPPPPDGGLQAWLQVAGGVFVFINTWGLLNAYGAFQVYYESVLFRDRSSSDISWIGTVQSCFITLGSVYSGPLFDWGYLRSLTSVGSFLIVFGMFMTSLCREYWQVVLAQGLLMGLGLGCLFTPAAGVVATYFTKRRGLAMAIIATGSTIGGVLYPIIFDQMVAKVGFGWACRTIAFLMVPQLVVPMVFLKQRIKPAAARRIFEWAAWKDAEFSLYAISVFIGYTGMLVPYFYIQLYCSDLGIIKSGLNFYLLPIMNATSFFGRLAFGLMADRIGPMNSYAIASLSCTALLFGWMGIRSEAGVLAFVVLYGITSSGLIALPATVTAAALTPDMRSYGVRLTMICVPAGLGVLIGNPIAGVIQPRSWLGLQAFSAATVAVASVFTVAARVAKAGPRLPVKI